MKKILLFLCLISGLNVIAQAPQKMSYQAIIRNSDNLLVQNGAVGVKISILQGSTTGTAVYEETHSAMTNENGALSIEIGNGNIVSGVFSSIDWKTGSYWLQTEVDPQGGTNYTITAVSQLLSVPYAFNSDYAKNSGNEIQNVTDNGDGTLTFSFENGTSYTSSVLSGLQGTAGTNGVDGVSITNSSVQNDSLMISLSNGQTINAGNVRGLQGQAGVQGISGTNGLNGTNGLPGANGINIVNSYIQNDSLRIVLSNGQTLNAGFLAGVSITNTVIQNDSLIVSLSNGQTINAGYLNCPGQNVNLPDAITISTSNITPQSASIKSNYTSNGNEYALAHGVCISTVPSPTFNDKRIVYSSPIILDTLTTRFINLSPNTQYFCRSFTTNVKGTTYGNEISFTTLAPCLQAGVFNVVVKLFGSPGNTYNSTTNGVITINNDLSFSLNFSDTNAPFSCNSNVNFIGKIACNSLDINTSPKTTKYTLGSNCIIENGYYEGIYVIQNNIISLDFKVTEGSTVTSYTFYIQL